MLKLQKVVYIAYDPEAQDYFIVSPVKDGKLVATVYRFFDRGFYTRYDIYGFHSSSALRLPSGAVEEEQMKKALEKYAERNPTYEIQALPLEDLSYERSKKGDKSALPPKTSS